MGNTATKQQSTEQKKIIAAQKTEIKDTIRNQWSQTISENSALMTIEQQQRVQCAVKAQELVARESKPLIKEDLIAILLRLDPSLAQSPEFLQLSTGDLLFKIRAIIYSPIPKKNEKFISYIDQL